jgi:hypothetical protein
MAAVLGDAARRLTASSWMRHGFVFIFKVVNARRIWQTPRLNQ